MDKMDRMLHSLPKPTASPELAIRIQARIRGRHRRRQALRWTAASVLALTGLWMVSPAVIWLSTAALYSPSTPWLVTGADYLNLESIEMMGHLWNGMFSLQDTIESSLIVSVWVGALLLCLAMFFVVDWRMLQPPSHIHKGVGSRGSAILPSALHF